MNNLDKLLKPGHLVNRKMLYSLGFTRPDVDYYVRSGHLTTLAHGVYHRRSDYRLTWQEIVASLPDLGYDAHVGGVSVVREAGLDHFISVGKSTTTITLYSPNEMPKWISDKAFATPFKCIKQSWLSDLPASVYRSQLFGQWNREVKYSVLELALLEQLVDARLESDIVAIDRQLEGMATLSPSRLNELLMLCPSIKAKRLLGWLLERHAHAWIKHVKWESSNLGKGKRSIVKGGRFNQKWQITVPKSMENQGVHGH